MTVHPGWYDDGVTPGVERWFDGHGWTETTRPVVPAASATAGVTDPVADPVADPAAAAPVAAAATATAWVPQDMPPLPDPEPASLADPYAGGRYGTLPESITSPPGPPPPPAFGAPVHGPEPTYAGSAAAAGYPAFGTPYLGAEAATPAVGAVGATTGAGAPTAAASPYTAAASPYTAAAASPYTAAAAAPYAGAQASPYVGAAPSAPAAVPFAGTTPSFGTAGTASSGTGSASGYGTGATSFGTGAGYPEAGAGAGAAGYPGFTPAGYPARDLGVPGVGTRGWVATQDSIESAFRSAATERAQGERQSAVVMGIIGVVLLLAAGGLLRVTVGTGTGMVWGWGFIGGAVFLVKGAMSYVKSVRGGIRHFGPVGWGVSGVALLAAVVMVVTSLQAAFSPMPVEVGSCFTDEGPDVQQVDCSEPHDYTAVDVVDTLNECPASATVFARHEGDVVCLVGTGGFGFGD